LWHVFRVKSVFPRAGWLVFGTGLFLGAVLSAHAQGGQNQPRNLFSNPGFESARPQPNLWYGTTADGTIEARRGQVPVLTEAGRIANTAMPVSVALGDLNGNGLQDLMISGMDGYINVFFNSGTREEPKFTFGELVPIYLTRVRQQDSDPTNTWFRYMAQRIHLADPSRSGRLDLWIGNYSGEILRIPNNGGPNNPDFRQPANVAAAVIPTTETADRRWGNVFAPAIWDFDGDGRADLLIGEGSYSANSIHILLNQGSNAAPRFTGGNRHFLAYGMGREQLTPAVVDFNGNGQPDLLVTDRLGRIGLYSSSVQVDDEEARADNVAAAQAGGRAAGATRWQPGEHLPFISYLSAGGRELRFPGIPTVAVGDLTGNGLFDMVVGQTNGRVSFIKNTGTKEEPKFAAPVILKGEPTPPLMVPAGWEISHGLGRGNFLSYATVVTAEDEPNLNPPEGNRALKMGYFPNRNQIIRTPISYLGTIGQMAERLNNDWRTSANIFTLQRRDISVEVGANYTLRFQVKGNGVTGIRSAVEFSREIQLTEDRVRDAGRGQAVTRERGERVQERKNLPIRTSVSSNWSTAELNFSINFDDRRLNDTTPVNNRPPTVRLTFFVHAELVGGSGTIYFDDFQLVKR
jgi:hypothetical protein